MRFLSSLTLALILAPALSAATAVSWTVSTVAGTGIAGFSGDGGPANAAAINDPYGVVRGPDGALWFCEHLGHRIRRIAADGTISTIAGTGEAGVEERNGF